MQVHVDEQARVKALLRRDRRGLESEPRRAGGWATGKVEGQRGLIGLGTGTSGGV